MNSQISIAIDKPAEYDAAVHGGLPEAGDLRIITKRNGTQEGRPVAVLTFSVQMPDGSLKPVQAAVTVRNLVAALGALRGAHAHEI